MKKIFTLLIPITLFFLLTGCSAIQKASIEADARAKTLAPPADEALLYIVRPSFLGTLIRFNVKLDDVYIGGTGGLRYIYTYQSPGPHIITSFAENTAVLNLELSAGKTYYVEQIPRMGFMMARNKLRLLDDQVGKAKLSKCKLSADNPASKKTQEKNP